MKSHAEVSAIIDDVCEAPGFTAMVKKGFADEITQGTLKAIQGRINENVKGLQ